MCGICGFTGSPDENVLKRMTALIIHRGPDEDGYYADGNINLGMRRLSIIDVTTGHQPIHNEDRSIWIVFNGEIYNFQELKKELEGKGHKFKGRSDTEVILHSYEQWGEDCLQKFNGMFAFAIWDEKKKQIFIARDRVGIKPLYYYLILKENKNVEIKKYWDVLQERKTIKRNSIQEYMEDFEDLLKSSVKYRL